MSAYNETASWVRDSSTLRYNNRRQRAPGSLRSADRQRGNRTEGGQGKDHRKLVFRETDVIGHPVSSCSASSPAPATSVTHKPLPLPYFQSGLTHFLRMDIPEDVLPGEPDTRFAGDRHRPPQTWGVYLAPGWTTQAEEPGGGGINAQRAGDIVTCRPAPYLMRRITGGSGSGQRVWPPQDLWSKTIRDGRVARCCCPERNRPARCLVPTVGQSPGGGGVSMPRATMRLEPWRPYSCCRDRGHLSVQRRLINYPRTRKASVHHTMLLFLSCPEVSQRHGAALRRPPKTAFGNYEIGGAEPVSVPRQPPQWSPSRVGGSTSWGSQPREV